MGKLINAIIGFDTALIKYPLCTNGALLPAASLNLPKYPLLKPAVASAIPSNKPINTDENPMLVKNKGMMGISISLDISLNRLTSESTQIVRVRYFTPRF
jgi:hypothetical protein